MDFGGTIGRTYRDSVPWWPPVVRPSPGAPNVVLVVLDDVGYAQLGCYGSDIETPHIDALASEGVRLANFHTTSLCSPTRACLLSGRNHHRCSMGRVADLAVGFPGYWGTPSPEHGFLSEILREAGYATFALGKWHLTPEDQTNVASSKATWPLRRGFDRWYGFHGGETHQFVPALFYDHHAVRPRRSIDEGYHLSEDLVDRAIEFVGDLRAVDTDQPFFSYLAFGACHSPHQPPRHWREHYEGHFDDGWDAWRERTFARQIAEGLLLPTTTLSPRPDWVPAFDALSRDEQRVAARFMECFAGFLSHADEQLGRFLAFLDEIDERENTLVVVVSDNGASAEGGAQGSINDARLANLDPATPAEMLHRLDEIGGPSSHNNYPWGWTMAGNTPFRRWKREVHEGGVADPCVVSWPRGSLDHGALRRHFAHAIDVAPTILELVGVETPHRLAGVEQSELDGVSLAEVLKIGGDTAPERHDTQYFEMFGSRAIYHRGWKAVTYHAIAPLYDDQNPNDDYDHDRWELYRVSEDLTETRDLADEEPEMLRALIELWWREAERNQVLPLDHRVLWALVNPRPDARRDRERARYFPGGAPVPEPVALDVRNRSHDVVLEFSTGGGDEGVLLAAGCVLGGWSVHVLRGRVRYVHNLYGASVSVVEIPHVLGAGRHRLVVSVRPRPLLGAEVSLILNDEEVAHGELERTAPASYNGVGVGVTCGYEWGPSVGRGYEAPFRFSGTIHRAELVARGPVVRDPLAEIERILSEQ